MANTYSSTVSNTLTFTRLQILKSQISITLNRTTIIDPETLKSVIKGIENKWIEIIKVYALDSNKLCIGELILNIDWDKYNQELSKGNATVVFKDNIYKEDTILEIDQVVILFNEFVKHNNCNTYFVLKYPADLDSVYINGQLGFTFVDPPIWKSTTTIGQGIQIDEMPELKIGFRLIDDSNS